MSTIILFFVKCILALWALVILALCALFVSFALRLSAQDGESHA